MGTFTKGLALGVGLALTGLGGGMFGFTATSLYPGTQPDFGMDLFVTLFFLVICVAGILLVQLGRPGFWTRRMRQVWKLATPETLFNPVAHSALLVAIALVLLQVFPREPLLPVFGIFSLFVLLNPLLIALRPNWWLHALLSLPCAFLLLGALPGIAETVTGRRIGESAMAMLGPVMAYPFMLVASGLARWWIVKRNRGTGSPPPARAAGLEKPTPRAG